MPSAPLCPCSSGLRAPACCAPFHRGEREPPTPEALMRSRYSAYALKQVDHLWRTLHPSHPDRARPEEEVKRELRQAVASLKYPGLAVLDAEREAGPDGVARVLFHARVFEKGRDRSFLERSDFRHDGTGWRYVSGTGRPAAEPPAGLSLATFGEG
jgi:SEC-C motif-containing protein